MIASTAPIQVVHHSGYTIHAFSSERSGVWFPQYQIFKDGLPCTSMRISLVEPMQSARLAIDAGIDLAKDDIRLGLFEFAV